MLSIKVDDNNDIGLDGQGNLALITEADALTQNTVTAMKAQRGEMILAMLQGMPTLRTAWENLDIDGFEAMARRVILGVEGTLSIQSFDISQENDTLQYSVTIASIYGNQTIGGSIG